MSLERSKTVKRLQEMRTVPEGQDIVLFHTSIKSCSGFGDKCRNKRTLVQTSLCTYVPVYLCMFVFVMWVWVGVGGCELKIK